MRLRTVSVIALVATVALVPVRAQDKDAKEVAAAVATFKSDADLAKWFDSAYGYVVFPSITKAAVVVGGAAGNGQVFEKGAYIGDAHVSQATIGAQLGGQSFAEVIFFETKAANRLTGEKKAPRIILSVLKNGLSRQIILKNALAMNARGNDKRHL